MKIFRFNIILRALAAVLVVSCSSSAIEVTVSGTAPGDKADPVQAREAALAEALVKASETAEFKIESNSILIDETNLISSTEIRSSGFVESYTILSEGWISSNEYRVEIDAVVVSMPGRDDIRERPTISLEMTYPREMRTIQNKIVNSLYSRGFVILPESDNKVVLSTEYRHLDHPRKIHYTEAEAEMSVRISDKSALNYDIPAKGFGGTERDALKMACDLLVDSICSQLHTTFSEQLAGIEADYTLIVEGRFDADKLLEKLLATPWIIGPKLTSKNAVSATFSLSTNRGFAVLQQRMKTWGYLDIGRSGNQLRFVYRD